jgi:TonB family protein
MRRGVHVNTKIEGVLGFAAGLVLLAVSCQRVEPSRAQRLDASLPEIDFSNCPDRRLARVGGADEAPVVIRRVEPAFGPDAPRGIVIIETVITRGGDVCAARVLRGLNAAVDEAALAAVRQWKFVPAKKSGQPVQASFSLTIRVPV